MRKPSSQRSRATLVTLLVWAAYAIAAMTTATGMRMAGAAAPPAAGDPTTPTTPGQPTDGVAWPDTPFSRLEALALLQTLNAELLSHDSATLTLEQWCGSHRIAEKAEVVADRVSGIDKPAGDEQRQVLKVSAGEPVRYRRVQLACGGVVLSEADNWYVPARLSAEMNKQLDNSDTPFGKVVRPLQFQRHTLSAHLLWQPLPEGWDTARAGVPWGSANRDRTARLSVPAAVLEHRAVLTLPDGTPFSEVIETYTGKVLAFPAPVEGRVLRPTGHRPNPRVGGSGN